MASKAEKIALGLSETASDDEILARIGNLVAAEQLLESSSAAAPPKTSVRLALVALSGSDGYYNRGSYRIPTDFSAPLILDLENALAETENRHIDGKDMPVNVGKERIAEIVADSSVVKLRSDTPVTAPHAVRRYKPQ
jgi:hypothetical protein